MELFDSDGTSIGTYDPATGTGTAWNPLDQALATDIAQQWYAVGYGRENVAPPGVAVVDYAGSVPPADPIAAGLDVSKVIRTAQGVLYRYQRTQTPTGTIAYQPVVYQPGAAGGNLLMYAAIAGLALLALS